MSRDLTPKQFFQISEAYQTPFIVYCMENTYHYENGKKVPLHTDQEVSVAKMYPKFGACGGEIIAELVSKGCAPHAILEEVEKCLNGEEIEDKELADVTLKWFEGKLVPGYYMDDNTDAFFEFLMKRIKKNNE